MYIKISFLSWIIRQFMLPNPFEPLGEGIYINGIIFSPELLNYFFDGVVAFFTYTIVGFFYRKGVDYPSEGSGLYLFFYIVHFLLIYIFSFFKFNKCVVIPILSIYLLIIMLTSNTRKNRYI